MSKKKSHSMSKKRRKFINESADLFQAAIRQSNARAFGKEILTDADVQAIIDSAGSELDELLKSPPLYEVAEPIIWSGDREVDFMQFCSLLIEYDLVMELLPDVNVFISAENCSCGEHFGIGIFSVPNIEPVWKQVEKREGFLFLLQKFNIDSMRKISIDYTRKMTEEYERVLSREDVQKARVQANAFNARTRFI